MAAHESLDRERIMTKSILRASAALQTMALLGAGVIFAAPATAQTASGQPVPPPVSGSTPELRTEQSTDPAVKPATDATTPPAAGDSTDASGAPEIVVTGSILRRTSTETPSPITVVTAESLDQRGISTIQEGLQTLASNNGAALTNSFSANGAFAAGASAVSLRGLSTSSTLVLFDSLRGAYYPLADDGSRNFVDLNTIPDDIVERIEVLRDGASSSYGADAIAGVVNIITRREFKGVQARGEAGISERGDANQYRFSLTAGKGDISSDGFNVYASAFYFKSDALKASDRGYPFNTDDLRRLCNDGVCGPNNIVNGEGAAGFGSTTAIVVRPRTPNGTPAGAAVPGSTRYQLLTDCGNLQQRPLTPAELADPAFAVAPLAGVCQEDNTLLYGNISPKIARLGFSTRATVALGEDHEAYAMVNFIQSTVSYSGLSSFVRANAPVGIFFPRFSTSTGLGAVAPGSAPLALPIYICSNLAAGGGTANGVNPTCTSTTPGAVLNPDNPFAAAGQSAQVLGRLKDVREFNETRSRGYRGALGLKGTVLGDWGYQIDATAMHIDLRRQNSGYVYIQNFLDALGRGQYSFRNTNSQETLDFIAPDNINNASSDLYQVQGVVSKDLFELPGGPVQLGVGASWRYEAVDAPSGNSDVNGPTQRYFRLNAFGTSGKRNVYSAFGELAIPILPQAEINLSGRYDKYDTGNKNFSPKVGFKVTPIRQLAIRGTWSKGFRIPSFGEANALPTTGFVTATKGIYDDNTLSQYGCSLATFTSCPAYIRNAAYGLTTLASPDLKPEKSRSMTLGIIFEPVRNWAITIDYFNIKKTGAITNPDTASAIAAYYAGTAPPSSSTVVPDAADPNFPLARPRIAFVESQLINADTQRAKGIDFALAGTSRLFGVKWSTALDASYIIELSTTTVSGTEQYAGTLGNYNLTAGSGTPRWKGSWQNTFDFGPVALTGTANYYGGYNLSAEDQTGPDTAGECGLSDGYTKCDVDQYITFDLVGQIKIAPKYTLYLTMINVFDNLPPIDPVTYGAHLYNPVQGGTGILGRYFKAGVKLNF